MKKQIFTVLPEVQVCYDLVHQPCSNTRSRSLVSSVLLRFLGQWSNYQTAADSNARGRDTEERGSRGRSGCRAEQPPLR